MKCGYCGKPLKENAKFCTNCGRSISDASSVSNKPSDQQGGSSVAAVISLILVIFITFAGCIGLIHRDIRDWNITSSKGSAVSQSDTQKSDVSQSDTAAIPEFKGDPALLGTWRCTDKTAAGYSNSDYGISTQITLTFSDDGTFALDYKMEDTGIQVRKINLTGIYSVDNGTLTLFPKLSAYDGDYFTTHGEKPSVKYSVADNKLTMTTADSGIIFTNIRGE